MNLSRSRSSRESTAQIQKLEKSRKGMTRKQAASVDEKIARFKKELVTFEKQIEAINNRDDVKPLVEKLAKVSASFK